MSADPSATKPDSPALLEALARLEPIVEDWSAFLKQLEEPLPKSIWLHPHRADAVTAQLFLPAGQDTLTPLAAVEGAFQIHPQLATGRQVPFHLGHYHVQDLSSMLPVLALAPQPHEQVLDMCAAPGGKTAQIAFAMELSGTVVANDLDLRRIRAIRAHVNRLGLPNVVATAGDATHLPFPDQTFDRVLADVPCSCLGTAQRTAAVERQQGNDQKQNRWQQRLQDTQYAILREAFRLCRPGGRIVYSTCTYTPEENEAMIDRLLQEVGDDQLSVIPHPYAVLKTTPGITNWQGASYHPDLAQTTRIWPHLTRSGGFYIAVLQKAGSESKSPQTPLGEPHPVGTSHVDWQAGLDERFGLRSAFWQHFRFHQQSNKYIHLVSRDLILPAGAEIVAAGIRFMSIRGTHQKLTHPGSMFAGPYATRNTISLDRAQTIAFLRREIIPLHPDQLHATTGPGFVLVSHDDPDNQQHPHAKVWLSSGYLRTAPDPTLESLFPKADIDIPTR